MPPSIPRCNLEAMLARSKRQDRIRRYTITNGIDSRRNLLRRLQRMNMSRATLFPGLDGFAASLRTYLANADLFGRSADFHEGRWM